MTAAWVRRGEEKQLHAQVVTFGDKRWRAARRNNWIFGIAAGVELWVILALSVALAAALPLVRLVPVYYPVQGDGSMDPPSSINHLAGDLSEQALRSTALQYVNACEGYFRAHAQYAYDLCSLMSAPSVRAAYQRRWFLPTGKPNPESNPQLLYDAKNGQVDIKKIKIDIRRDHVVEVRFSRTVRTDDDFTPLHGCTPPSCTTWTASLELQPAEKMTQDLRDQVQSGLVVVRYQLSEGAL